jgi:hypothetical protein
MSQEHFARPWNEYTSIPYETLNSAEYLSQLHVSSLARLKSEYGWSNADKMLITRGDLDVPLAIRQVPPELFPGHCLEPVVPVSAASAATAAASPFKIVDLRGLSIATQRLPEYRQHNGLQQLHYTQKTPLVVPRIVPMCRQDGSSLLASHVPVQFQESSKSNILKLMTILTNGNPNDNLLQPLLSAKVPFAFWNAIDQLMQKHKFDKFMNVKVDPSGNNVLQAHLLRLTFAPRKQNGMPQYLYIQAEMENASEQEASNPPVYSFDQKGRITQPLPPCSSIMLPEWIRSSYHLDDKSDKCVCDIECVVAPPMVNHITLRHTSHENEEWFNALGDFDRTAFEQQLNWTVHNIKFLVQNQLLVCRVAVVGQQSRIMSFVVQKLQQNVNGQVDEYRPAWVADFTANRQPKPADGTDNIDLSLEFASCTNRLYTCIDEWGEKKYSDGWSIGMEYYTTWINEVHSSFVYWDDADREALGLSEEHALQVPSAAAAANAAVAAPWASGAAAANQQVHTPHPKSTIAQRKGAAAASHTSGAVHSGTNNLPRKRHKSQSSVPAAAAAAAAAGHADGDETESDPEQEEGRNTGKSSGVEFGEPSSPKPSPPQIQLDKAKKTLGTLRAKVTTLKKSLVYYDTQMVHSQQDEQQAAHIKGQQERITNNLRQTQEDVKAQEQLVKTLEERFLKSGLKRVTKAVKRPANKTSPKFPTSAWPQAAEAAPSMLAAATWHGPPAAASSTPAAAASWKPVPVMATVIGPPLPIQPASKQTATTTTMSKPATTTATVPDLMPVTPSVTHRDNGRKRRIIHDSEDEDAAGDAEVGDDHVAAASDADVTAVTAVTAVTTSAAAADSKHHNGQENMDVETAIVKKEPQDEVAYKNHTSPHANAQFPSVESETAQMPALQSEHELSLSELFSN